MRNSRECIAPCLLPSRPSCGLCIQNVCFRRFGIASFCLLFSAHVLVVGSDGTTGMHELGYDYLPDLKLEHPDARASGGAQQAAAQLLEHIAEGTAALREVASQLAEQRASLVHSAGQAFRHLSEQSSICATCAVKGMREVAAQLAQQQQSFVHAVEQTAARLAQRQAQIQRSAGQAAAQFAGGLAERQAKIQQSAEEAAAQFAGGLPESPAVLKAAAAQLHEIQVAGSQAMAQLNDWQKNMKNAASKTAAQFVEGVAESQVVLAEAAGRLSEPQMALRRAVEAVSSQLSEKQMALAQAASATSAQLARSAASSQETLRHAAATAAELLYEHELLLRQSSTLLVRLADIQATVSPSAGRISAQLAQLQRLLQQGEAEPTSSPEACSAEAAAAEQQSLTPDQKPFAFWWLIAVKEQVRHAGLLLPLASLLFSVAILCLGSTLLTIVRGGGEDADSLGYRPLLSRAACWLIHRLCLGWWLVLISDMLEKAPLHIPKYDAMGWPTWNTLLPFSSQLIFFIPAAAILNTAVAQRSRARYSTPTRRRFYASLSREVHASILGCFVSDWFLFPTDLTFFAHHLLGLGIIFGVWSMVLREARSIACAPADPSAAISFWWVTGLSIATMEAASFFYCLYSLMSFGDVLHLSLFAVFTYSNVLSIMCVIAQHPWRGSAKAIWMVGGQIGTQSSWLRLPFSHCVSKSAHVSMSYMWKSFMVAVICLARQKEMWANVREQMSTHSVVLVGTLCVLLAGGCVWRLRDFDGQTTP
eukprot:TRINITY_DN80695_c0_g1_i1.p1 TRINITY_DN80695_c0_g1~~TRINITY_DN80695_c0_g1_i1.p1  ORF type:complete len:762 (+),score=145.51 TRINITY_DN80695_c0_g1_i1:75-2360(+)